MRLTRSHNELLMCVYGFGVRRITLLVFVFVSCLRWSLWGASTGEPRIPPLHNSQHAQEVHVQSRGATSVQCHQCEGGLQEKGRGGGGGWAHVTKDGGDAVEDGSCTNRENQAVAVMSLRRPLRDVRWRDVAVLLTVRIMQHGYPHLRRTAARDWVPGSL